MSGDGEIGQHEQTQAGASDGLTDGGGPGAWHRVALDMLLNKRFPQLQLQSRSAFASDAGKRGLHAVDRVATRLEDDGLFFPLLRCRAPVAAHRVVERSSDGSVLRWETAPLPEGDDRKEDTIEIPQGFWFDAGLRHYLRDEAEHLWPGEAVTTELRDTVDEVRGMPVCWTYHHPSQILLLAQVHRRLTHQTFAPHWFTDETWERFSSQLRDDLAQHAGALRSKTDDGFRMLALLLAVEDLYVPVIRQVVYQGSPGPHTGSPWAEWRDGVDREAIAGELGMGPEAIAGMRGRLADAGRVLDPCVHLYPLLRHLPYHERQRLRGDALLAWDYYEAAEVLGMFLEDLTGERQPQVDDLWGAGPFKLDTYGIAAEDFDYRSGTALPGIARKLGIDPRPRLLWVIEGETEQAFVEEYCEATGTDLQGEGIKLYPLSGLTRAKDSKAFDYMEQVKQWEAALVVTVDNDLGVDDLERTLRARGLIGPERRAPEELTDANLVTGLIVWPGTFEDANFTAEQLFEAWLRTLPDVVHTGDVDVEPDDLRDAFAEWCAERTGAPLKLVMDFAKRHHQRYGKPAVGRQLVSVIDSARRNDPGMAWLPIEKALFNNLAIARHLHTGRFVWQPPGQ